MIDSNIAGATEEINTDHFSPDPTAGEDGRPVELTLEEELQSERTFGINQVNKEAAVQTPWNCCFHFVAPHFQFNLLASDLVPLNRSLPDVRRSQCRAKQMPTPLINELPDTSVIIVFHNEVSQSTSSSIGGNNSLPS